MPEVFKVSPPRLVFPSKKVTFPVGIPPFPLTVAVKVTSVPATAGFCEEVIAVELRLVITCLYTPEVLPTKALSPL